MYSNPYFLIKNKKKMNIIHTIIKSFDKDRREWGLTTTISKIVVSCVFKVYLLAFENESSSLNYSPLFKDCYNPLNKGVWFCFWLYHCLQQTKCVLGVPRFKDKKMLFLGQEGFHNIANMKTSTYVQIYTLC